MTQYSADFDMPAIFPPQSMVHVLAEWLSVHGVQQCHVAGKQPARTHARTHVLQRRKSTPT